jgi:hypothetical protein
VGFVRPLEPRRARVDQSAAILAAEFVYHQMVCAGEPLGAGWRATLGSKPDARSKTSWEIEAEVLANAVWRRGRLLFRCPAWRRRATRLYVPSLGCDPRCRRCRGLSYESRSWGFKLCGLFGRCNRIRRKKQVLELQSDNVLVRVVGSLCRAGG